MQRTFRCDSITRIIAQDRTHGYDLANSDHTKIEPKFWPATVENPHTMLIGTD